MPFDAAETFNVLQDSYKKNLKQSQRFGPGHGPKKVNVHTKEDAFPKKSQSNSQEPEQSHS